MVQLLTDTGPLVALRSRRDAYHAACKSVLAGIRGRLVTTWPVLTEACYLLRSRRAAVQGLLRAVEAGEWLRVIDLPTSFFPWAARFFERFGDREPQLADASLVYLAETLDMDTVFTLDRRDFGVYRTGSGASLTCLPE